MAIFQLVIILDMVTLAFDNQVYIVELPELDLPTHQEHTQQAMVDHTQQVKVNHTQQVKANHTRLVKLDHTQGIQGVDTSLVQVHIDPEDGKLTISSELDNLEAVPLAAKDIVIDVDQEDLVEVNARLAVSKQRALVVQ